MRQLAQVTTAVAAQDGDGVNIHRLAGRQLQQALNPFLMIDEINSDDATMSTKLHNGSNGDFTVQV